MTSHLSRTELPSTSRWTATQTTLFQIYQDEKNLFPCLDADGKDREMLADLFAAPLDFAPHKLPYLLPAQIRVLAWNQQSAGFFIHLAKVLYKFKPQNTRITRQMAPAEATARQAEAEDISEDEDMTEDEEPTLPQVQHQAPPSSPFSEPTESSEAYPSSPPLRSSSYHPPSDASEDDDSHLDREQCEIVTQSMMLEFLNCVADSLYLRDGQFTNPAFAFSFDGNQRRITAHTNQGRFVSINDGSLLLKVRNRDGDYTTVDGNIFCVLEAKRSVRDNRVSILAQQTGEMIAAMKERVGYLAGVDGTDEDRAITLLGLHEQKMFVISAEQSLLYFGQIVFPPDYLRWFFGAAGLKRKTREAVEPEFEVALFGSRGYDLATSKGRLDAAEVVLRMLKEVTENWRDNISRYT